MNPTVRSLAVLGMAVTSLASCGKSKKEEPAAKPAPVAPPPAVAAPAPAPTPPPPPPKPQPPAIAAAKGLFDCNKGERAPLAGAQAKALPFKLESCPTIPSVFGTLAWGMDVPTALKASKAKQVEGYQGAIDGQLKLGKTRFTISFNDVGHANEIFFSTKQAAVDAMTAAWGAPLEVTDLGDKVMMWFNAAKQTRVEVKADTSEAGNYYVRYRGYVPVSALVAADGLLSKPMIGEPATKVAELAGDLLKVESKDQAAADLAAMKLDDRSAAIAKWAGADEAKASLVLLGNATKSFLSLSLRFEDGKLDEYGTLIETFDNPAVRDEYLAEFAAALGPPTAESSFEYDEPTYVFAAPGGHKVKVKGKGDLFLDIYK